MLVSRHLGLCPILLFLFLGACVSPVGKEDVAESFESMLDLKSAVADILNQQTGDGEDQSYRYVPLLGPVSEPGTVLAVSSSGSPSVEVVTVNCLLTSVQVENEKLLVPRNWSSLPEISKGRALVFNPALPDNLHPVLKILGTVEAGVELDYSGSVAFKETTEKAMPRDVFESFITVRNCSTAIGNRKVFYVRGQVSSKVSIKSKKEYKANLKVKSIQKDKNLVAYDQNGGFEVIDTEPTVHFLIVTKIEGLANSTRAGSLAGSVKAPTREEAGSLARGLQNKKWLQ